jgi:hypothetical protein
MIEHMVGCIKRSQWNPVLKIARKIWKGLRERIRRSKRRANVIKHVFLALSQWIPHCTINRH